MSEKQGEDEKKKSDAKGILYLGEDEGFWQDLKEGFKVFKQINFEFNLFYENDSQAIQSFLRHIYTERPRVVFIDLAKNTPAMLHLLRCQTRLNSPTKPFVIALTGYTQGDEVKRQAIMAGAQCVHVKSAETEAVIYDAFCFAFQNSFEDHGFAMAKMSDEVQVFFPAKVGVLSPKGLRVESNYKGNLGETVLFNTYWSNKGVMKTRLAQIGSQEPKDLYYNFDYAQELSFEYGPFEMPEGKTPEEIEKLKKERALEIQESKEAMANWVAKQKGESKPKALKTLVVDKELTLFEDQPLSDSFPFVMRIQPYLVKVKQELMRHHPHMIAYNMENVDPEELEANQDLAHMFNEGKNLQYLIKVIRSIGDFEPFIVVFNTMHDTKKLQKVLNYSQIIGHKEPLNPELIVKMAQLLERKLFGGEDPFGQDVVVLDKTKDWTYAEFEKSVTLTACSENDLYFDCDEEFDLGLVLRLNEPANMYITIAEPPGKPKTSSRYYAIIHGIGEEEKKILRRYINSVFFREKEAAKAKEREEVQMAKERYLQEQKEKEEEERLAREEAEKADSDDGNEDSENIEKEDPQPV